MTTRTTVNWNVGVCPLTKKSLDTCNVLVIVIQRHTFHVEQCAKPLLSLN